MRTLLLSVLLMASVFSAQMLEPLTQEINNGDRISLGKMGPGQTMPITIHNEVYSGGIHGIGGNYDLATVDYVPDGWSSSNSLLYGRPLQVTITSARDAPEGRYSIPITVRDERDEEALGNVSFIAEIEISNDVLGMDVSPNSRRVGLGQPAVFEVTIDNKGSTGDLFVVSSQGVPKWSFTKTIYVAGGSTKTILYEVAGFEEEEYAAKILVQSANAPAVRKEADITVRAVPDVLSDYKATINGALLFPIFEAPVYALVGLISNLW